VLAAALKNGNLMKVVPEMMEQIDKHGGQSADNFSVVAACWEDNYIDPGSDGPSIIHTQTMSLGAFTTSLDQFGRNPKYKANLTDEEIERAIDEIRFAIQKYSK
jgi:hypothetical protein